MGPKTKQLAAIEIKNLSKTFPRKKEKVLDRLNLTIPAKQISFVLGPSGTGKSVLLKHIVGLLRPDEGEIDIFGQKLPYGSTKKLNEMRKHFGVLFQGVALFDNMTVYENVAFPLCAHQRALKKNIVVEMVSETLLSVGLDPSANLEKYPNELSGGMQKRVGLARAIVLKPDIILYDEPTTGLDPVNRQTVEEMILEAKNKLGLTNFVISHDLRAAIALADKIAFIFGGQIVFSGNADEFQQSSHPVIRSFLRAEEIHKKRSEI